MRQGKLTPEEADEHPQRSIITRALGAEEGVEADSTHVGGARRRRLPDLLGRADLDDPRGPRGPDPGRGAVAGRRRAHAHRRGQRRRRARQHHGRPLPPGGGRPRARLRRRRPPSTARWRPSPRPPRRPRRPPRGRSRDGHGDGARGAQAAAPRSRRRPGAPSAPSPARPRRPDPRPLPGRLRGPRRPTTPRRPSTSSAPATTASSRVYRGLPYDLPAGLDLYSVNYESGVPVDELTPAQAQDGHRAHAALQGRRAGPRQAARDRGAGGAMTSARNRELLALIPASLLLTGGLRGRLHRAQRRGRRTSR